MIIDRLEAINFKSYVSLDLRLNAGINLFVGTNGSGKTSMLEAINVALGGFFGLQESKMQRLIKPEEIRLLDGKQVSEATIRARSLSPDLLWSRTIRRETNKNDNKGVKEIAEYGQQVLNSFESYTLLSEVFQLSELQEVQPQIAPLIAYYSTQRLFNDATQSAKQVYDVRKGRRNGYLNCLKDHAIKPTLNSWLMNAVIRRSSKVVNGIADEDYALENVEAAIVELLANFLSINKEEIKLYPDPDFENEIFIKYSDSKILPISYYSDGFRNVVYLIMDMVWRASQLNPWFTYTDLKENTYGFVTIDEIDLHLHPKWQAQILPFIGKLFPNVQFFATTHSPTVVANFENGTLYVIEENNVSTYNGHYFGKRVNEVIRDVLGAVDRHQPTQQMLDKLFRSIDDEDVATSQLLYAELKNLLGEDDIDLARAAAQYEYVRYLKNNPQEA